MLRRLSLLRFPAYPASPPEYRAASSYPVFPCTVPDAKLGRAGKSLLLGLLDVSPHARWTADFALQNCSYVQRRPILRVPPAVLQGDRGECLCAQTELHPEVLEAMQSAALFRDAALQAALELGWDASDGYRERFKNPANRNIQSRELGVKCQISGHAGLNTLSVSVNDLEIKEELPHSEPCLQMVRAFHHINDESLSNLKPFLLTEISKIIPRSDWPTAIKGCPRLQRNLADFLYHDVQMYAVNACQWHCQSLRDVAWKASEGQWVSIGDPSKRHTGAMLLPEHHDGGRAFLVWAISLWTLRTVRLWDDEGRHEDMQTFNGHTYFAGFLGPKHQVRHEHATVDHALASETLGPMEVVLFIRSTCFRHNKLSLSCRIAGESDLVAALMRGVAAWQRKHEMYIPNMEDIEAVQQAETAQGASSPQGQKETPARRMQDDQGSRGSKRTKH